MYDKKKHNFLYSDMELRYNDKILHPMKQLANYSNISRSYILFNNQDEIVSTDKLKGLLFANDCYYHNLIIGNKIKTPTLILSIKKNYIPKKLEIKCKLCDKINNFPLILPCCRKYCCNNCEKLFKNKENCNICNKPFNFTLF